jgi:hypothetical protein
MAKRVLLAGHLHVPRTARVSRMFPSYLSGWAGCARARSCNSSSMDSKGRRPRARSSRLAAVIRWVAAARWVPTASSTTISRVAAERVFPRSTDRLIEPVFAARDNLTSIAVARRALWLSFATRRQRWGLRENVQGTRLSRRYKEFTSQSTGFPDRAQLRSHFN